MARQRAPLRAAASRPRRAPAVPRCATCPCHRPAPGPALPLRRTRLRGAALRPDRLDRRADQGRRRGHADRRLPRLPRRQRVEPATSPHDPVDPHSDRYIAALPGNLHPDFGSGRYGDYGIPFTVVPATQPLVADPLHRLRRRERPGPVPGPLDARVEGGSDRHVLVVQQGTLQALRAVRRRARRQRLERRLGRGLRPALQRAAPGRLDVGRRGRAADLARPRARAAARDPPRAAVHRPPHAEGLRRPGAPLRLEPTRPEPAADGAAAPAEGRLRHLGLPRAGARDPPGAAAPTG